MGNLHIIDHPLIRHKLTYLRDKNTIPAYFRQLVNEITLLMFFELSRSFKTEDIHVETPLEKTKSDILNKEITLIPIMRAGLGMLNAALTLIPDAHVAHIGLYRDERTKKPVEYYFNCHDSIENNYSILIDPMLATGGSAVAAARLLKERGLKDIRFMCLIAAPEGVRYFHNEHPDIDIFTAVLDSHLDENAFIRPGLGDAGDRVYNT